MYAKKKSGSFCGKDSEAKECVGMSSVVCWSVEIRKGCVDEFVEDCSR